MRVLLVAAGCLVGLGCPSFQLELDAEQRALLADMAQPVLAEPDTTNAWADDPAAAHLGQYLYFDVGLSSSGEYSCATCHDPALGFADGLRVSEAAGVAGRHAPTVLNSAYQWFFFWDGRCDSLWCQALGPIEADVEMAATRLHAAHRVHGDPELRAAYEAVFGALPALDDIERFPLDARPRPETPEHPQNAAWQAMDPADQNAANRVFANIGKAIAAYERLVLSGRAPFDDFAESWLAGEDASALLAEDAQRGLQLFVGDANCWFCHFGPSFSNRQFSNIGLADRDWLPPSDAGRYVGVTRLLASPFNGTGPYSDDPDGQGGLRIGFLRHDENLLGQMKVPGLRDVAKTAPYMHGGHFETLLDVVTHYDLLDEEPAIGHIEEELVPLDLSEQDRLDLVAFLESLSGPDLDPSLSAQPISPLLHE